jgi:hypothetical protein
METVLGQAQEKSKKIRPDAIPNVRAAGFAIAGIREKENADFSIRQDVHMQRSDTPEHLRKYRKSHANEPGKIQRHWGMAEDAPKQPLSHSFGKTSHGSEHVDQVMQAQHLVGLADKFNQIKENQYASQKREPLGQSYSRGYQWPQQANDPEFRFGVGSSGQGSAKEMLYPERGAAVASDGASQSLYRKTHGNFAPGEQRRRDYEWKVDPTQHAFGYAEKRVLNGAALALQSERQEEQYPKTTIVLKTVEDHKAVASDHLGRSKNLGQG